MNKKLEHTIVQYLTAHISIYENLDEAMELTYDDMCDNHDIKPEDVELVAEKYKKRLDTYLKTVIKAKKDVLK